MFLFHIDLILCLLFVLIVAKIDIDMVPSADV